MHVECMCVHACMDEWMQGWKNEWEKIHPKLLLRYNSHVMLYQFKCTA